MDDPHDGPHAREPQLKDLARLGRLLNAHHVRYVLIGGFAIITHGGGEFQAAPNLRVLTGAAQYGAPRVNITTDVW